MNSIEFIFPEVIIIKVDRFVKDMETEVCAHITAALLSEVIHANRLSLKISEIEGDGLYGRTVVEAHRLLKNEIGLDSYVLISDAFVDQLEEGWFENHNHDVFNRRCELYSDVGKICYTFFPGTTLAGHKANDRLLQLQ